MNAKIWIKRFFLVSAILAGGAYSLLFMLSFSYPLPVFNHISLDAKLKFLSQTSRTTTADTIIMGSSMGLVNINGVLLEDNSTNIDEVLNYSAWGLNPVQIEQLLPVILDNGNIQRIIYASQPIDFSKVDPLGSYDESLIHDYVYNTLSILGQLRLLNRAANNYQSYWKTIRKWEAKYQDKNVSTNLLFDKTGGVTLKTHRNNFDRRQPDRPHEIQQLDGRAFQALERVMRTISGKKIRLYFVVNPQRRKLLDDNVERAASFYLFSDQVRKIVQSSQGVFLNLHAQMGLDDTYLVDNLHLNEKGSSAVSEVLAGIIDAES